MAKIIPSGISGSRSTHAGSAVASAASAIQRFIEGGTNSFSSSGLTKSGIDAIMKARQSFNASQTGQGVAALPQNQEQAVAQANQQNEERKVEIEGLFDQRIANIEGVGATRRAEIGEAFDIERGALQQDFISRGLANNTSALKAPAQFIEGRKQRELTSLEETLALGRNDVLSDRAGFLERITESAPSLTDFFNRQAAASSAPRSSSGTLDSGGSSGGGTTDFAGRDVQPFGKLIQTGNRNNTSSNVNTTSVSSNERQRALKALADHGIFTSGMSSAEINKRISASGITINSASDVNKLSKEQLNMIKRSLSGLPPVDPNKTPSFTFT